MSSFRTLPFVFLCAASLSRAQSAAPASAPPSSHSHTPAAASQAHGAVTMDQFVISASAFPRSQVDLAQSTTVLSDRQLLLKQQTSLGETLAGEPGMSATSFGPGASRPIIRGLGGDRIRLLDNGVGTIDASVTSPDHAVSVEPFLVERIEVLRGPASLLYGANAVGGVVNVITHRIETDMPTAPVRGMVEVRGTSATDEFSRGGVVDLGLKLAPDRALVLHLDGFRRDTDDIRIPGYAESARVRQEETEEAEEAGEAAPDFAHGRLRNSALEAKGGAVGLSYVSPTLHLGASYSGYDTYYGVPGHTHGDEGGVRIDLEQRRTDVQGEWHHEGGLLRGARVKFGHARYKHAEIESDGTIGTTFSNKGFDARAELLHGDGKPWSGALGVQTSRSDFAAEGEEAFLPPSLTRAGAIFAFEEIETGPVAWQVGARLERTKIEPEGGTARTVTEPSASAGLVWKFSPAYALALSVTHTGRAPNAQELFADGPHAGTQAFEIGDATLDTEKSLGFEASLRRRTGVVTGALTVFANRFDGYIFEQPTGEVAVAHGDHWHIVAGEDDDDDGHGHDHEEFPVYRYFQRDARFWGVELEAVWHVHESSVWGLDLRLAGDLTRGSEGGRALPRIPARRITTGALWSRGDWSVGAECQFVFDQKRVAAHETTSDSYTLASAYVARAFEWGRWHSEIFLRGTNLLDEEVRPHTSFVKDLAPAAGRSVTLGLRLGF